MPKAVVSQALVPFDAKSKEVLVVGAESKSLIAQVSALTIHDDKTRSLAADLRGAASRKLKKLDEMRKFFTDPLNAQLKRINAVFKEIAQPLEKAKAELNTKILTDYQAQEQLRIEQARREAEAQAVEEAKASGVRSKAKLESIAEQAADEAVYEPPAKQVIGAASVMQVRETWKHELIDPSLVPREYLSVDDAKIKDAIKRTKDSGGDEAVRALAIPGVRIYLDKALASY